jgi:hypothetical protein
VTRSRVQLGPADPCLRVAHITHVMAEVIARVVQCTAHPSRAPFSGHFEQVLATAFSPADTDQKYDLTATRSQRA